jgi:ERCC4-type nuclease
MYDKPDNIKVIFDSNELSHAHGGRDDRIEGMKWAIASRKDGLFEGPYKSSDQIVDLRFIQGNKSVWCEIKKEKDLISSWRDERLGKQAMAMSITGENAFILCIGSDAGLMAAWPTTSHNGPLSQDDRFRGWKALMSYLHEINADLGVPTHFRSIDPFGQALSIAKHLLNPNEMPNIPKKSFKKMAGLAYPAYMLSRGPGISETTAIHMLRKHGSIFNLAKVAEKDISQITDIKVNGRKIGSKVKATFEIIGAI